MAAIDDLGAAVTNLQAQAAAAVTKIQDLKAQVAAAPPDQTPAIVAATAGITAAAASLAAA